MRWLENRAIVITGAGRGLGFAYAIAAAKEGARVVVNDVDAPSAERALASVRELGADAYACPGSVTDWDFAADLVEGCVSEFGRIDGLVNNAGYFHMDTPLTEEEGNIRRAVEVNVLGTIFCGLHAIRAMAAQGEGVVVNITSGAHLGMRGMATYGATKGADASLTYGWATDLAGTGVRVNALSPMAETPGGRATFTRALGENAPPLLPDPMISATAVVYLLSDRSKALNGQVLRIDGDFVGLLEQPRFRPALDQADAPEQWTVEALADVIDDFEAPSSESFGLSVDGERVIETVPDGGEPAQALRGAERQ